MSILWISVWISYLPQHSISNIWKKKSSKILYILTFYCQAFASNMFLNHFVFKVD